MDVQTSELNGNRSAAPVTARETWWTAGLLAIVLLAALLRLHGIHQPLLDHPGWRQGDTASIARNFAQLRYNFMFPQTMYDGPPPNYVELELQIVPFLAATLYKVFGVHEVFGRLISLTFSVGTVVTLAYFARWLFASATAGIVAAAFFAVVPGSVYYGRSFMPDTAMVFFLTAAMYAVGRFVLEDERLAPRALARTAALLALAYLAKPVAAIGLLPLLGVAWERASDATRRPPRLSAIAVLTIAPLLILWLYDRRVASYAEWHWASGITMLHVLPALRTAVASAPGFAGKCVAFRGALGMLASTMLGPIGFGCSVAAFAVLPWIRVRSKALPWGWLVAALLYVFVVVTVERVDYYLYPLLPLCALVAGGAGARWIAFVRETALPPAPRWALVALVAIAVLAVMLQGRAAVASYYAYNAGAYRDAVALNAALDKTALVVIGHYGPDVQYYVNRFGWEEDPMLWTPFDEESAIRKGARYFISIEDNRLRRNQELCAWLQRFPVTDPNARWIVYQTDPAKTLPGADAFWRAFRAAERAGKGRAFLDRRPLCSLHAHGPMTSYVRRAVANASG